MSRDTALKDAPMQISASKSRHAKWGDSGLWVRKPEIGMAVDYVRADQYDRLWAALQIIVDSYDARSELFTSDADCAANLADHARLALNRKEQS